jgi:hypothetical protein
MFLLGGGAYLRWKPTRAQAWNYIAAWAAENRDAAITREARKREYLAAEVIAAAERERDEAQAQVADLRAALEAGRADRWAATVGNTETHAFAPSPWVIEAEALLDRTPAQSLGRLKAAALREAVEEVRNDVAATESAATTRGAILCIADRLEDTDA